MAKAYKQKARKEYTCGCCGATIHPGESYYKIERMYRATKYRCNNCPPKRAELTESEYLQWLYNLQDNWRDNFGTDFESLTDEIQTMYDDLSGRFDNIPEQLQEGSAGETLQTRMDSLDSAISDLDQCEEFESLTLDDLEEDDLMEEDESGNMVKVSDARAQEILQEKNSEAEEEWESNILSIMEDAISDIEEG